MNGGAGIYKTREEHETDQFNIREHTANNSNQRTITRSTAKESVKKKFSGNSSVARISVEYFIGIENDGIFGI